jgi:hypothetical protein
MRSMVRLRGMRALDPVMDRYSPRFVPRNFIIRVSAKMLSQISTFIAAAKVTLDAGDQALGKCGRGHEAGKHDGDGDETFH